MKMTSLELPDELYRTVKHQAVDESTSFKGIVQRALYEYLAKAKQEAGAHRQESQSQM